LLLAFSRLLPGLALGGTLALGSWGIIIVVVLLIIILTLLAVKPEIQGFVKQDYTQEFPYWGTVIENK